MNWQPIETLPDKDIGPIIGFDRARRFVVGIFFEPAEFDAFGEEPMWEWTDFRGHYDSRIRCTHWMPLPEPPSGLTPPGKK